MQGREGKAIEKKERNGKKKDWMGNIQRDGERTMAGMKKNGENRIGNSKKEK